MRFAILCMAAAAVGCTEHIGRDVPPLTGGSGVSVDPVTQTVSLDLSKVPVLPSCGDGQFVEHADGGWGCAMPEWAQIGSRPSAFPAAPHTHAAADVTDFAAASAAADGLKAANNPRNHDRYSDSEAINAMGAKSNTNSLNHDRYSDSEAVSAMGVKANANSLNHDRYSDSEAVAALGKATGTVGVGTTSGGANLTVAGTLRVNDGTQGPGKVLTSDATGNGSWQPPAGVPSGAVMFFNLSSCPVGWSEFALARGRYVVGLPLSGTALATVGTALTDLENRAAGQHSHGVNDPGHTHSYVNNGIWQNYCGGNYCQTEYGAPQTSGPPMQADGGTGTGITVAQYGTVAGTNAPYVQLLICQKN